MINTSERFLVDENGTRTAVLLELDRYENLLEAQEELESIRLFDEAKASNDEAIPFSQAIAEIEESRK
jgi:PHD/YefM family antitoxin component YafN of YafNO toxin-antitoxin module